MKTGTRLIRARAKPHVHRYYGWPYYWQGDAFCGMAGSPILEAAATPLPIVQALVSANYGEGADAHLRSLKDMVGFKVQAKDGVIGHASYFQMDSQSLAIPQLVIKGQGSFAGRELHLSTRSIDQISNDESMVLVNLTIEGLT